MFCRNIFCQILVSVEVWHLLVGFGGLLLAVFSTFWKFQRARKKDMKEVLDEKADKDYVDSNLRVRDQRFMQIESALKYQTNALNEKVDEQFAIITNVQSTVTNIYDILSREKRT